MRLIGRLIFAGLATVMLSGCLASTEAKSQIGKSLTQLMIEKGRPVNAFNMPDGRRAVQYYWGGGTVVLPSTSHSTVNVVGNTAYVTTHTNPGGVVHRKGCLMTYIARANGNGEWIIEEGHWPKRLFC